MSLSLRPHFGGQADVFPSGMHSQGEGGVGGDGPPVLRSLLGHVSCSSCFFWAYSFGVT